MTIPSAPRAGRCCSFILVTLAVGAAASVFTEPTIPTWYAGLVHPAFAPPDWVFAPVWTALYVLMAVAAWRVWRVTGLEKSTEMVAYAVQLALNFGWSAIFFGLHRIGSGAGGNRWSWFWPSWSPPSCSSAATGWPGCCSCPIWAGPVSPPS